MLCHYGTNAISLRGLRADTAAEHPLANVRLLDNLLVGYNSHPLCCGGDARGYRKKNLCRLPSKENARIACASKSARKEKAELPQLRRVLRPRSARLGNTRTRPNVVVPRGMHLYHYLRCAARNYSTVVKLIPRRRLPCMSDARTSYHSSPKSSNRDRCSPSVVVPLTFFLCAEFSVIHPSSNPATLLRINLATFMTAHDASTVQRVPVG